MGQLSRLSIPIAPLNLQNEFAQISERIERTKAKYETSLAELENLYNSLSQRAFRGELNLGDIEVVLNEYAQQPPEPQPEEQEPEFSYDYLLRLLQDEPFTQPFSFETLMTELEKVSFKEEPEYETIKGMIFTMLKQEPPVLSQSFYELSEQKIKAIMLAVSTGIRG
jgi:type I restriction enzyme S subunit